MQAFVFGLATPLLPLLVRRLYQKKELKGREMLLRYVVYTFVMTVFSTVIMIGLCDDDTSFLNKVDVSPIFALKYLFLQLVAMGIVVLVDWNHETQRYVFTLNRESFAEHVAVKIFRKAAPFVFYVLAVVLLAMNVSMVNDNVLWGDEAFSADLVRHPLSDMMHTITTSENHPPLYYLWLKLWEQMFGESGPAYHMASVSFFIIGVVLGLTLVRKHFGKIPTAFFLVISGLSASCLEYNVEIRMYALAFLSVAFCYYCAARILQGNRLLSWVGMVFWGLVAAYDHYYALIMVSILMLTACLFAVVRFGRKTWIRVLIAGAVFVLGYLPWLSILFSTVSQVNQSWWMETRATVGEALDMVFGGTNMKRWTMPLWLCFLLIVFLVESSVLRKKKDKDNYVVELRAPGWLTWSGETFALATGAVALIGTIGAALVISELMHPMLARRYVYPLAGVVAMMLVIGSSEILTLTQKLGEYWKRGWLKNVVKCLLVIILALMVTTGMTDYKNFTTENEYQSARTEEVLYLIGELTENTVLVNNGVTHLGWTVLKYYYPGTEIINGSWRDAAEATDIWYFTTSMVSGEELEEMGREGYGVSAVYPDLQMVKYPLTLYHLSK